MSSYLTAEPEALAAASADFSGIGAAIKQANSAAAGWTVDVLPAAGDEVSAAIARLFGGYAADYQALSARTAVFHDQFVQALRVGADAYAGAGAANASPLQTLLPPVKLL